MEQVLKILLDNLSVFLQNVLVGVLPILATMATAWLVAKVKTAWQESKLSKTVSPEQLAVIAFIAVNAAEQLSLSGKVKDKKEHAIKVVNAYLRSYGLSIDLAAITNAVEAAVMAEFNKSKKLKITG